MSIRRATDAPAQIVVPGTDIKSVYPILILVQLQLPAGNRLNMEPGHFSSATARVAAYVQV
jgi:hypothetical protein